MRLAACEWSLRHENELARVADALRWELEDTGFDGVWGEPGAPDEVEIITSPRLN